MALSEQIKKTINGIRDQFPTTQALLIPLLHEVQKAEGWVSMDSMRSIGEFLELPLARVREVATFYTMFKLEPQGKVDIQVCGNISCWLNGSENLKEAREKRYGVKCGETTPDGRFTLSEVECLASCGTAPVVQLNEDYHETMDVPKLMELLDQAEKDLAANRPVGLSTYKPGVWP